ncbi:MAG: insulinase family protein [Oscillospiraceae bacterium]|nr:insulinase family protein [Oscillospiraceae bacterium]
MTHKEYPKIGEELYCGRLPNGLSIYVAPKRGFNKYYAHFATDYGGADRRFELSGNWIDTPAGVAHFLEHKMFEMKYGDALTKLSANGADPNAYTSTDITAYHFECTEKFAENLETLLEFVSTPYFIEKSIEKERGIIGQEILMGEDDPDYCIYYNLMKALFRHNPLRDSVAGTLASIEEISAETLYDCHKVFYNPSNMVLCVAGDVDAGEVMEIAERVLPKEPGPVPGRDYGQKEGLEPVTDRVTAAMDVSMPVFIAGCKSEPVEDGPGYLRNELVSGLALDIMAGHSSKLYIRLYGEGLISNDFSASFDAAAGVAYTMFGGETNEPERVFGEVVKEIERLSEGGADAALFERIKKAAIGSQIRSFNSFEAICSGLAGGHFRGFDAYEAGEALASIGLDDVTKFFRERLVPANMAMSIITPRG